MWNLNIIYYGFYRQQISKKEKNWTKYKLLSQPPSNPASFPSFIHTSSILDSLVSLLSPPPPLPLFPLPPVPFLLYLTLRLISFPFSHLLTPFVSFSPLVLTLIPPTRQGEPRHVYSLPFARLRPTPNSFPAFSPLLPSIWRALTQNVVSSTQFLQHFVFMLNIQIYISNFPCSVIQALVLNYNNLLNYDM